MRWGVLWRNRQRAGAIEVEAASKTEACQKARAAIQGKYYWQGPVEITGCKLQRGRDR